MNRRFTIYGLTIQKVQRRIVSVSLFYFSPYFLKRPNNFWLHSSETCVILTRCTRSRMQTPTGALRQNILRNLRMIAQQMAICYQISYQNCITPLQGRDTGISSSEKREYRKFRISSQVVGPLPADRNTRALV
jgi:hypothetical protein